MATRFKDAGIFWGSVFQATVLLHLICSVPATLAQPTPANVLNIDCGATATYVDPTTLMTWLPDAPYITTGKTQSVVLDTNSQIYPEMRTLRYFDDLRSKNCYSLPVVPGGTYILKTSFYYGNYDNANAPPTFQIALDATVTTNATAQLTFFTSEYTYVAQGNVSYLCLIRASSTSGAPYISGISLKEASGIYGGFPDQYKTFLTQGVIMKTRNRVNYGGTNLVRAPDDYYDRTWTAAGPNSAYNYLTPTTDAYEFLSTNETISDLVGSKSWPPSLVMQTAVTTAGTIATYLMPKGWVDREISFFLSIYYTELNSSAPVRNFTFTVPTLGSINPAPVIDFTGYGYLGYNGWDLWMKDFIMRENTTMFLSPLSSTVAGPILSALEVFERIGPYLTKTIDRDALAIEDIKQNLNLTEWTGDPCLPSPHDWVTCTIPDPTKPQPVVTAVNLTGRELKGSIPASFANLWDLISLDLSSNNLTGPLQEWLTTMTALRVLSVQNNQLSGVIPSRLLATNSPIRFTYRPGNEGLGPSIPPAPEPTPPCTSNCKKSNIGVIVGVSVGGVIGLLIVLVLALFACRRWKRKRNPSGAEQGPPGPQLMRIATTGGAKAYTLAEVTAATSNFKRELGKGGFGPVYYGKLPDGHEVAVKVADGSSKHEGKEFYNEVDVLSTVHHKNLVSLVGYCQEEKAQILLYEYMHNGSLFDHLHGNAANSGVLDWQRRLHIALNAAQGLEYLHTGCSPSFIHRDVKSSNILLTSKWEAKVADFGLTRLLGESEGTRVMTNVMGTAGYLDPEYYTSHYISIKSDVYSFGIVLLELLTGCLPIDKFAPEGRNPNLAQWVRESLMKNDIDSVLDPAVKASRPNMEAVWKVAEVAMQSVEPKGMHRPTMSDIVQELQGALTMEATNVIPTSSEFLSGSYGPTSYPTAR